MINKQEHKHFNEDKLSTDIKNFGWTVLLMPSTDYLPSFAYTVGLWKNYKHPELISFGLTTETLHLVLNDAAEIVRSGQRLEVNKTYDDFFENSKTEFIKVDSRNIDNYFGNAINFYSTEDFPALQLVWADRNDKLPWDKEYEKEFKWRQPLLDRNAEFKFREVKNLRIFTTKQWLELDKPILRVVHEFDGDWQFLTEEFLNIETEEEMENAEKNVVLVCLEEMVKMDKSLNELFDLDYGEFADRNDLNSDWCRDVIKDEPDEND